MSSTSNNNGAARKDILIDDKPVTEWDFKAMHPSILYAKEGYCMFDEIDDAYDIPLTIYPTPDKQRDILKKLMVCMIGANNKRDAINACKFYCQEKCYNIGYHVLEIAVDALCIIHDKIKHHFFAGKVKALQLQFIDSQICELILKDMMEQGVVCLPVHDSFIVRTHNHKKLYKAMNEAFVKITGQEPVIDKKY